MKNNRNTLILFFTMIVVMLGFGIVIPILPFYVESFGASGQGMGILMSVFSVAQLLFSPIWGRLSDRFGRKPILMVGVFGNALSLLMFGLSTSLLMLYISRGLAGALSAATLPTAMAIISDSTTDEERGGGMGIIGAAMGIGMVLGPGIGGLMATSSLSTPFFFASGMSVIAFLFILFVLPESLPPEKRDATARIEGPGFKAMWQALSGPIGFLLILALMLSFGLSCFESIFGLFAAHRFDYGPQQVGSLLTVIGLVSAAVQGMLTGPATRRWGEVSVINASLICSAVGFILLLLAYNYATIAITVGIFTLSNAMLRPGISSLISKRAEGGQGIAMGLNNSFMSLGRVFGPLWAGSMFDVNIIYPYLSASFIMLISFLLSLYFLRPKKTNLPYAAVSSK